MRAPRLGRATLLGHRDAAVTAKEGGIWLTDTDDRAHRRRQVARLQAVPERLAAAQRHRLERHCNRGNAPLLTRGVAGRPGNVRHRIEKEIPRARVRTCNTLKRLCRAPRVGFVGSRR
ncbi:hypothetical protein BDI4_60112 [Burkholderia diffusa]|nr:hypothetical protein BDI4_60112 [Burkholderia diffusa]